MRKTGGTGGEADGNKPHGHGGSGEQMKSGLGRSGRGPARWAGQWRSEQGNGEGRRSSNM